MDNFDHHPYTLGVKDVSSKLQTNVDTGLSSARVSELQTKYPPNELDVGGSIPWYSIFIRQLCNAMIIVLAFAMALSFGINDYVEGGVLAVVIVLNVTIGFVQEYGAEKKMDALRALSSPSATVLRDGKTQVISNPEVVAGDIVLLKMGDTVPADLRVFEAMNLACDEAALTGEALPIDKIIDVLSPSARRGPKGEEPESNGPNSEKPTQGNNVDDTDDLPLGDRANIAYATAVVRKGRGRGIVIATGMTTEVGKIAADTSKKHRAPGRSMNWRKYGKRAPVVGGSKRIYDFIGRYLGLTEGTPLQIKLSRLAYMLFGCALLLAVVVFGVNEFKASNETVLYAISTGIAIIPESLVAVLTITMVQATRVMRKANVVVRDLSALEALGGVTNICSDKTGTLTQGAMIVKKVWLPFSNVYTVRDTKDPSDPKTGRVTFSHAEPKSAEEPEQKETRDLDAERSTAALKFDVPDEKLNPPTTKKADGEPEATVTGDFQAFLISSALCNLATVRFDDSEQKWQTTGEPTEIALQVFSHRFDQNKKSLEGAGWKQLGEFPFDSSIKRMSVIYDMPQGVDVPGFLKGNSLVFTKGAVERVLDLCTTIGVGDGQQEISDELKQKVLKQMDDFASQGQRVLAIAYKQWDGLYDGNSPPAASEADENSQRQAVEQGLTLLGLAGIYDPPRKETTPAIRECSSAGIKVHMLTGDHPATATAIAKEVGIIPHNLGVLPANVADSVVYKATDFDRLTDTEIDALEQLPLVIARCAPDTKTRMIEALRRRRAFMAMTGDGVNDAPSLSRADVGIAMGSGSDVAKSASKIVLTDDKFNSIVAAIREGRRMFENIQKFILHLLTSNVGEVILLIAGLGFRDADNFSVFPISPLEILWINMLTSSFPAFGLGRERAAADVMRKPPHDKKRGVFTNQILVDMMVYGTLMGTLTLLSFVIVVYGANDGQLGRECNKSYSDACIPVFRARATVFAELTWLILVSAWEFKDMRRSLFCLNPDSQHRFPFLHDLYENRFLFWSIVIGMLSVFATVNIPELNTSIFKHTKITWEWALVFGATLVFIAGMELWKMIKRSFGLLDDRIVDKGPWGQGSDEEYSGRRFTKTLSFSSWMSFGKKTTTSSM